MEIVALFVSTDEVGKGRRRKRIRQSSMGMMGVGKKKDRFWKEQCVD